MIEVARVPLNSSLHEFTDFLWQQKIPHRVVFSTHQVIYAPTLADAEVVRTLFESWQRGEPLSSSVLNGQGSGAFSHSLKPLSYLKHYPLTLVLISFSLLFSWITDFGGNATRLAFFTITDFNVLANDIRYYPLDYSLERLQLWRYFTPVFLHFSLVHLAFNALWIWVIGRKIEAHQGSFVFFILIIVAGVGANIAQYFSSGPIFGGLSAIVYAVMTYAWFWDKRHHKDKLNLVSNGLMRFMCIWLILGYSGLLDTLGFGQIANTAYLVGLLSGLLMVPLLNVCKKKRK